jgi:SAM-dependent methyltransferase
VPPKNNIHGAPDFRREYAERTWAFYRGLVSHCIALSMPGKIVDVGAGLGLLTECACRYGLDCTGLEPSAYAVREGIARYPGLDLRQHVLPDRLPFETGGVATVVANQVIEHLEPGSAEIMLTEGYRVLVPGGAMMVFSPSRRDRRQRKEPSHVNLYTPASLQTAMRAAGFVKLLPLDSPLQLGHARVLGYMSWVLFRLFPDRRSRTANCVGYKPEEDTPR